MYAGTPGGATPLWPRPGRPGARSADRPLLLPARRDHRLGCASHV